MVTKHKRTQPASHGYPGTCLVRVCVEVASAKPELLVTSETQGLKIAPGKSLSRVAVRKQKLRHQVLNPGSMKGSEELARCRITMSVDNLLTERPGSECEPFSPFAPRITLPSPHFARANPARLTCPMKKSNPTLLCNLFFSYSLDRPAPSQRQFQPGIAARYLL